MSTRVATGAVTVLDVFDGVNPLAITLENQSHTFSGDSDGVVLTSERQKFSSSVFVFIGENRGLYDSSGSPANNTYKITSMDVPSGWSAQNTITSNQAVITCTGTPNNTANKSAIITLNISITNSVGIAVPIQVAISWATLIEGAGGTAVYMTPSRLTFQFDETGTTTTDGSITLALKYAGDLGGLEAEFALNGSTTFSPLIQGTGADKASVIDIDGTAPDDRIVITPSNFSNSDILTIRVKGITPGSGSDTVSIVKIKKGAKGLASLFVSITSNSEGFVFKNNSGSEKTLTAQVYDMADGSSINTGVAYVWQKNGVNISGGDLGSNANSTSKTFKVTAAMVANSSSDQFQCNVTVT